MKHIKNHFVFTTILCVCMGILSCVSFGEDPGWEDAVPVEDTAYEAEEFLLNEDPADVQAAEGIQDIQESESEPGSEELQDPEEDLLSDMIVDDPETGEEPVEADEIISDEEAAEADEIISDDELFETFETLPMASGEVWFSDNDSVLLNKDEFNTSELIKLNCANKILKRINGDLTIHVDEDIIVRGIICNYRDTSLQIDGDATLTVASDRKYEEQGNPVRYPAIKALNITVEGNPTIISYVSSPGGSDGTPFEEISMWALENISVNGGTLLLGTKDSVTYAMRADRGTISIKGGTIKISSDIGIAADEDMTGAGGNIVISGGILEASGKQCALAFKNALSISSDLTVLDPVGGTSGSTTIDNAPWNTIVNKDGAAATHVLIGKVCTVTFNTNGKGTAPAVQNVITGRCAVKPADPSAAGFLFGGWYTDSACTTAYSFSAPVNNNLTLYAKWTATSTGSGDITPSTPVTPVTDSTVESPILSLTGEGDLKEATYGLLKAKGKATSGSSIKLTWKKIEGATSYVIYGNKCGKKKKYLRITSVSGLSYTQKKLKKGTYYKYIVVAVKDDTQLAVSKTIHVATKGGKRGNFTGLQLSKKSVDLKKNKTLKITAKTTWGPLKVSVHRKVAWESSNPKVATVNSKGRIRAIAKGTCYIYAYTQNGICQKVKVRVK